MRGDERGFTLIEMTIVVAILAVLTIGAGLWAMGMRPAELRSTLDRFDSALAATRALAQSEGNGATLAFQPDARGFEMRVYRGRPNAVNAVFPTSVALEAAGVALREQTLGAPPFAIFVGSGGHISGIAHYPPIDAHGIASFPAIAREPSCPPGGFSLSFTSANGARVVRMLSCASIASRPVPNPTPTPNAPLLTPKTLLFDWPGAPAQRLAATEWGYTHWFASASGFACAGGTVEFPDVLPAPFTPARNSGEASAPPFPPSDTPYSFPNSNGASTNDAPAFFPVLAHGAGLCTVDVVDEFAQHAGARAQVMGGIALQNVDGSPAQPIDLTLAHTAPVVVYASKTYDTQIVAPSVRGCAGSLQTAVGAGSAPPAAGLVPARTPIALRATQAGACTLAVSSQYAGEPPAILGVRVRGPLTIDPPAISFAPGGGTLPVPVAGNACFARAFTDATFSTADTNDARLAAANALGGIAYDPSSGCFTAAGKAGAIVEEAALTGARFAVTSSTCRSQMTATWRPGNAAGPSAQLAVAALPSAANLICTLSVADTTAQPASGALALRVAGGCPNAGNSWSGPLDGHCYDLYELTVSSEATTSWTTIGIAGFYVPHGTPGAQFLSWLVQDSGGCVLTMTGGTVFAQWGAILSNGNPQPPPVGAATVPNGAGFSLAQTAQAVNAIAVAPPQPAANASFGPCTVVRVPAPPSEPP